MDSGILVGYVVAGQGGSVVVWQISRCTLRRGKGNPISALIPALKRYATPDTHAYWKLNLGNSASRVTMHIHLVHLWSRRSDVPWPIQYVTSLFANTETDYSNLSTGIYSDDKCFRHLLVQRTLCPFISAVTAAVDKLQLTWHKKKTHSILLTSSSAPQPYILSHAPKLLIVKPYFKYVCTYLCTYV